MIYIICGHIKFWKGQIQGNFFQKYETKVVSNTYKIKGGQGTIDNELKNVLSAYMYWKTMTAITNASGFIHKEPRNAVECRWSGVEGCLLHQILYLVQTQLNHLN